MNIKSIKLITKTILLMPIPSLVKVGNVSKISLKKQGVKFRIENGDIGAVFDVFIKKNYEIKPKYHKEILEAHYLALVEKGCTPLIYDFGAHIGGSAVFFAKKYKDSKIFAVEPSRDNYDLLLENTESISNIEPVNEAVFQKSDLEGEIYCSVDSWGDNIFNETHGAKKTQNLANFLMRFNRELEESEALFICKIDIEGAEKFLFDVDYWSTLNRFKCVMIEFHDWLFPNEATSQNALKWLSSSHREIIVRNEMIYVFNK